MRILFTIFDSLPLAHTTQLSMPRDAVPSPAPMPTPLAALHAAASNSASPTRTHTAAWALREQQRARRADAGAAAAARGASGVLPTPTPVAAIDAFLFAAPRHEVLPPVVAVTKSSRPTSSIRRPQQPTSQPAQQPQPQPQPKPKPRAESRSRAAVMAALYERDAPRARIERSVSPNTMAWQGENAQHM